MTFNKGVFMVKAYIMSLIFLFAFGLIIGVTAYDLGQFAALALK